MFKRSVSTVICRRWSDRVLNPSYLKKWTYFNSRLYHSRSSEVFILPVKTNRKPYRPFTGAGHEVGVGPSACLIGRNYDSYAGAALQDDPSPRIPLHHKPTKTISYYLIRYSATHRLNDRIHTAVAPSAR